MSGLPRSVVLLDKAVEKRDGRRGGLEAETVRYICMSRSLPSESLKATEFSQVRIAPHDSTAIESIGKVIFESVQQ